MNKIGLAIHGGAGVIIRPQMTPEKEAMYASSLRSALMEGWDILNKGGASVDAVTRVVQFLEDDPLFNAGKGSVFTAGGEHEMDASIMDGKTLRAGCVTAVRNVRNPVILARKIMEESSHVFLCGKGAEDFARAKGLKFEPDEYFFAEHRYSQYLKACKDKEVRLDHSEEKKFGTVGAVALDSEGNLASATSTGGMTNKMSGRVGDSSIIGAGTYANNLSCAVSCTGQGEYFIITVAAYDVFCLMQYKGLSLKQACREVIHNKLALAGGEGGLAAVDAECNICFSFNSKGMYRASIRSGEEAFIKLYED